MSARPRATGHSVGEGRASIVGLTSTHVEFVAATSGIGVDHEAITRLGPFGVATALAGNAPPGVEPINVGLAGPLDEGKH
jgi:hypothetical protein